MDGWMDGWMDVIVASSEIDCGWEGGDLLRPRRLDERTIRLGENESEFQRIPATAGGGPGGENRGGSPGWRRGPIRGRPDRLRIHLLIGKCKLRTGVLRC